jgi:hypothetical protein
MAERLADRRGVAFPHLIVGASGDVLVVWTSPLCQAGCEPVNAIWAAIRPADAAAFESPRRLSPPGVSGVWPRGVLDARGNALVTWLTGPADESNIEGYHLTYALRPAAGQFGAGIPVAPDKGIAGYRIARAAERVALVWNRDDGHPVRVATGSVAGGFGATRSVGGRPGRTPRVALRGRAGLLAWTEERPRHQRLLRVASLRPDGPGRPRTIERANIRVPEVKLAPGGRRLVTWGERRDYRVSLHAALAPRGRPFRQRTMDPRDTLGYRSAATPGGGFLLTWLTSDRHLSVANAAVARPGRGFGPPTRLGGGPRYGAGLPRLAAGPSGQALAFWHMASLRTGEGWIAARYWRP